LALHLPGLATGLGCIIYGEEKG